MERGRVVVAGVEDRDVSLSSCSAVRLLGWRAGRVAWLRELGMSLWLGRRL